MKNALKPHAKEILTTDPHVTTDPEIRPLDEVLAKSDLLVLCTPHAAYKDLAMGETPLVDIWRYIGSGRV
jgi:UDP-N-acetyl-D-mannosaminuronic acid dehydrogenase